MLYAIVFLVFAFTAVLVYFGLSLVFSEERAVSRRLDQMSAYEAGELRQAEPLLRPFSERVIGPAAAGIAATVRAVAPTGYRERVRQRLVLAGSPRKMSAERFIALKALGTFVAVLLVLAAATVRTFSASTWLVAVVFIGITFYFPDARLNGAVADRQKTIRRALPDMLDMLTISVEAGLGFDAAVSKLVRNSSGPLAEEFGRALQEIQAGVERSEALKHMTERTEVPELNAFIMAMVQADMFGISVSKILRAQSHELRVKRRQRAQEMAQKAPAKMVFPLILCVLPATLIVLAGPAVISIGAAFGML